MVDYQIGGTPGTGRSRKRIYLHIGLHKTGTTSIQYLAAKNDRALLERGVLYPTNGRPAGTQGYLAHHLLPWSLSGQKKPATFWPTGLGDRQQIWTALLEEMNASEAECVLISSEEFDTLSSEQVQEVARLFEGADVTVLCFLRRADIFLHSMYCTEVIHSRNRSNIADYIEAMDRRLDYAALLAPWRLAFGQESVLAMPYLGDMKPEWSVAQALFPLLGIDDATLRLSAPSGMKARVNKGYPWYVVESVVTLRKLGLSEESVSEFVKAQSTKKRGVLSELNLIPPGDRLALAQRKFASFQAALSAPLPEHQARWFRGEGIAMS